MPERHVVQPGDCIESIALQYGFFADSLWEHPENAELRRLRSDPHVLLPGDVVHVPDLQVKTAEAGTGRRHVFRRRGVPAKFRVVLEADGRPRPDLEYELRVDGRVFRGRTGPAGEIEHWIPPNAREAELSVGEVEAYHFRLGRLLPATEPGGVRARLENLGYLAREVEDEEDGEAGADPAAALSLAIAVFQASQGLEPTGAMDDGTRDALVAEHGS